MKVHLLFEHKNSEPVAEAPSQFANIKEDLELTTLLETMSLQDSLLYEFIEPVFYQPLQDPQEILYRQDILKDCLMSPKMFRDLYALSVAGVENKAGQRYIIFNNSPQHRLEGAVIELEAFIPLLTELRNFSLKMNSEVRARGWKQLFETIDTFLTQEYLSRMKNLLDELHFSDGLLVRARLGINLKAESYLSCRRPPIACLSWFQQLCKLFRSDDHNKVVIHERDESGFRILHELKDEAVIDIANTVVQARDHVKGFFLTLRSELAFYIGCMNLAKQIKIKGLPMVFPSINAKKTDGYYCKNLYNISLALQSTNRNMANSVSGIGKRMTIITGANQGGKTTFLRGFGQAKLMTSIGMFVVAGAFQTSTGNLYTHFKREEDSSLQSGKLDEELSRMKAIIELVHPGDWLLMNESFAATNEREGSEIAKGILDALLEAGVQVLFVTHFYTFAQECFQRLDQRLLFIQAIRQSDGVRTYKLKPGPPLTTGFGMDIYEKIFKEKR